MKCAICGIEIETIQEAIEQGWLPSFYEGETEHGPVCSSCAETMICVGEDGEMELKAEYCGKIQYIDNHYSSELLEKDLVMAIIAPDGEEEQRH